jgi:hypothetical protein
MRTKRKKPAGNMYRGKRYPGPCCKKPMTKYYSSWQDQESTCVHCGKRCREITEGWLKTRNGKAYEKARDEQNSCDG